MQRRLCVAAIGLGAVLATASAGMAQGRQDRQSSGVGLTVYADPEFRGESATFREDISNLQFVDLNDRITSLRVARGEVWEVCEHANYLGRCHVVSGAEPDLREIRWSDNISSARRIRDGRSGSGRGNSGQRNSLVLFSGTEFSGDRRSFSDELANLQFIDFNDKARSVRVEGNLSWQICVDANYQNCVVVSRHTSDLARIGMARRISSVRPEPRQQ